MCCVSLFYVETRQTFVKEIRAEDPGLGPQQILMEAGRRAGEAWRAMDEAERAKYKERAAKQMDVAPPQPLPDPADASHSEVSVFLRSYLGTLDAAAMDTVTVTLVKEKLLYDKQWLPGVHYERAWLKKEIGHLLKAQQRVCTPADDHVHVPPLVPTSSLSAPKKCAAPKVEDRTTMGATLQLTVPASATPISCFVVKLQDQKTLHKRAIRLDDPVRWQSLPVNGSFYYLLEDLTTCTPYRVQVLAVGTNANRNGQISDATTFCTAALPPITPVQPYEDPVEEAKPDELPLWLQRPLNELPLSKLELSVVACNQGTATPKEYISVPTDKWIDTLEGEAFQLCLSDREPGTTYEIMLRALGDEDWGRKAGDEDWDPPGWSEWSAPLTATTAYLAAAALPKAPDRCVPPTVKARSEISVTLGITMPTSEVDILHFEWRVVEINEDGEAKKKPRAGRPIPKEVWQDIGAGVVFEYVIEGLKPGSSYSVEVTAMAFIPGPQPSADASEKQKRHNRKWSAPKKFGTETKRAPEKPKKAPVLLQDRDASSFALELTMPHSETPLTRLELLLVQAPSQPLEDDDSSDERQFALAIPRNWWRKIEPQSAPRDLNGGETFTFQVTADDLLSLGLKADGAITCMLRGKGDYRVKEPGWGFFSDGLSIEAQLAGGSSTEPVDQQPVDQPVDDEVEDSYDDERAYLKSLKQKVQKLASSGKLKPANRTKVLTLTADYVFTAHYSKPYPPLPERLQLPAADHHAVLGVERPNHGLANAVRKAILVEAVVKELPPPEATSDIVLTMQVAMLFEVVGRESEVGHSDSPENYKRYRAASRQAFYDYAQETQLQGYENCYSAMANMFTGVGSGLTAHVRDVFEICHDLDLMRCTYEMKPKLDYVQKRLR